MDKKLVCLSLTTRVALDCGTCIKSNRGFCALLWKEVFSLFLSHNY